MKSFWKKVVQAIAPDCPFDFKYPNRRYSFMVDPGFVEYCEECDERARLDYEAKYVTCWDRFLHWLGAK